MVTRQLQDDALTTPLRSSLLLTALQYHTNLILQENLTLGRFGKMFERYIAGGIFRRFST